MLMLRSMAYSGTKKLVSENPMELWITRLICMYLCKKKKLFCTFIDYKKAFDFIDRVAIWHKLLRYNIYGHVLIVIRNMYKQAKSCLSFSQAKSESVKAKIFRQYYLVYFMRKIMLVMASDIYLIWCIWW